ncbi:MAG: DUF4215 domain-containing protein [Myxococcales bacterium]
MRTGRQVCLESTVPHHKTARFFVLLPGLVALCVGIAACSHSGDSMFLSSGSDGGANGTKGAGSSASNKGIDIKTGTANNTSCNVDAGKCYAVVDAGPYCGDGVIDAERDEICDDGNRIGGDGCSGVCKVEPNFECLEAGKPCISTVRCGNARREGGEGCDDGNMRDHDGCSSDCRVEPGWYCPTAGAACARTADCGDGRLQANEQCDLGSANGQNQGCDANCALQAGWSCKGHTCKITPVCGDGLVNGSEQCDEGPVSSSTGCCANCRITASYCQCSSPGKQCVDTSRCGNGSLEKAETCDDGNTVNGDGCSSKCTLEQGWQCRVAGRSCMPACGDGLITAGEECDDGNGDSGDGCSSSCRREPGYSCAGTPSKCKRAVCGNGVAEAGEGCDDGNDLPHDGCTPTCQLEPRCGTRDAQGNTTSAVGKCQTSCGDGILLRGQEECDDGNTLSGDGCSIDCRTEDGFTCVSAYDSRPTQLSIPIVYRDFQGYSSSSTPPTGHPDFGHYCCNEQKGIVRPLLDPNRKPVYAGTDSAPIGMTNGKTAFDQWYRDVANVNRTFYGSLTLAQTSANSTTYAMNSDADEPWHSRCGFFPIEDAPVTITDKSNANYGKENVYCYTGSNPYASDPPRCTTNDTNNPNRICYIGAGWGYGNEWLNHNYGFTSELRYWFQYQGGEALKFTGDDDVWVFVNGNLAADLGGVHDRAVAQVTLDRSDGTGQVGYGESPSSTTTVDFKLEVGSVYEVVVFQAERWCCGSNYMLTLANFLAGRSVCAPTCGNSTATAGEECDDGARNCKLTSSNGCYDQCTTECKYGPFCGDGDINGAEECDDGRNTTVGYNVKGCAPGCTLPPRCGDGLVQAGEECDTQSSNADNQCGGCSATCQLNAICGDAKVDTSCNEECDDGSNVGGYGFCGKGCKLGPRCGDGVTQSEQGEECDEGSGNSDQADATCTKNCMRPGFCGDGILQASRGEICDDGKNDGSCGGCTPDCQRGPFCGDGIVQKSCGEVCDYGDANSSMSSAVYGGCLVNCQLGPHCGDGVVQQPDEECDLGPANGRIDSECSGACVQQILII